ncbi:hypothetical protein [Pseudomonas aeruginosa]|uniref:hypothetical protein n=1 Tax=Pseudomonas aeruginosa TaxID=287 RepID=UPI000A64D71C
MPVPDLFAEGLARGWKTYNGSRLDDDLELEADVVVVGTGAGGGTTAEILSAAGLKVLLWKKPAEDQQRFQDAGGRRLPRAVPGRHRPDEQGRRHHHPPGPRPWAAPP